MRVVLVEDERMLRDSIKEYLTTIGHIVEDFNSPAKALDLILKDCADLLILDINLPDIDGFELLKRVRDAKIYTPTIYISALVDIDDISKGFTLGCSDYIKKPFHLRELALRVENIQKISKASEQNHIFLSKNYTYDKSTNSLLFLNRVENLTKRQSQILSLLAKNLGIVVDFEMFRDYVWNSESIDNATIRAEVSRFKKSLKEDFIKNVRGVGYKIDRLY